MQGKRAYDTDQYPAPAGSFDRPAPVYTTVMDPKAPAPGGPVPTGPDAWRDPLRPLPVPGANAGHVWHTRSLGMLQPTPDNGVGAGAPPAYVGSWSGGA